jgi:hypothetical protein
LWQHKGESLNEYAVATEALGRKADFDPKSDSTVRVHVSRLRQKLKEFYDSEGRDAPVRVSIPIGAHEIRIEPNLKDGSTQVPKPSLNRTVVVLAGVCLALAAACVLLIVQNRRLAVATVKQEQPVAPLPRLWRAFVASDKPVTVFLPNPVFFYWHNRSLVMRDTRVNDYSELNRSEELKAYVSKWGRPVLMQRHNSSEDTFAAAKLSQYFATKGIFVSLRPTSQMSLESLSEQNIILLGTAGTAKRYLKKLLTNFEFSHPRHDVVINHHPRLGESARFVERTQSTSRRTEPAIIALLTGKRSGACLLLLIAQHTSSLASLLVSTASLDLIEDAWRKEGFPPGFEAVVEIESDSNTVLRGWPVSLRALPAMDWEQAITTP